MREVTMSEFTWARGSGADVIDVSEVDEYERGHVPGAVLMPLRDVGERLCELRKDVPVYVIWASGNHSLIATGMLMRAGYDAYSVLGGTSGWVKAGHELSGGTHVHH